MNKPLKFKSYNPGLRRSQKSKKIPVPKMHSRELVPQGDPKQYESVAETLLENHDPILADWSRDSCAALQVGDGCSPYNEDNQVVHKHPHTSTSFALQSAPTACLQYAGLQSFSEDVSFHRWPQAGQQSNNTEYKRRLEHGHDGVETTEGRRTKQPKLTPADEGGDSPDDTTENNHSEFDDNSSGEVAIIPYSKSCLDAAIAHNETLLRPPASIQTNDSAFMLTNPTEQCSSRHCEEATACQPHNAGASCSSCAAPQQTNYLPEIQCKSCSTLRAALLEALSLLQRLLNEDVHISGCESVDDVSNAGYSLDNCSGDGTINHGETSNRDSWGIEGDEISTRQTADSDLSGQHRQLSQLEQLRLRAWKRENKSETWIACKLNNTKLAGSGFGRRMTQNSTRAKFTPDEDDLVKMLKEEERLTWTQIQERHNNQFHARSKEALQVRYCTKLKNRGRDHSTPASISEIGYLESY